MCSKFVVEKLFWSRMFWKKEAVIFKLLICKFLYKLYISVFPTADPHDDNKIGIDGIQQFCDDLSLDPASISVLVIAWKFRAATQCEFSKKEFVDGMTELGWVQLSLIGLQILLCQICNCYCNCYWKN